MAGIRDDRGSGTAWLGRAVALAACSVVAACSSGHSGASSSTPPSRPTSQSPSSGSGTAAGSTGGSSTGTNPAGATGTSAPFPTLPPVPSPQANQTSVLNALPGSAAATCAVVGTQAQLRAGSVGAGDFVAARQSYKTQSARTYAPEVNVFVIPQDASHVTNASVTVAALGGQAPTRTATSTSVALAGAYTYVNLSITIAVPGAYRLLFAVGANRGCFDVTFAK